MMTNRDYYPKTVFTVGLDCSNFISLCESCEHEPDECQPKMITRSVDITKNKDDGEEVYMIMACNNYIHDHKIKSIDEIIKAMRLLELDHEPKGWPAVQMRDITAMCDEIERLRPKTNEEFHTKCHDCGRFLKMERWVRKDDPSKEYALCYDCYLLYD